MSAQPPSDSRDRSSASFGAGATGGASSLSENGLRLEVVRHDLTPDGAYPYLGTASTDHGIFAVEAKVDRARVIAQVSFAGASGALEPEFERKVERVVTALLRAGTRSELEDGRLPPRKVVRWRSLAE